MAKNNAKSPWFMNSTKKKSNKLSVEKESSPTKWITNGKASDE